MEVELGVDELREHRGAGPDHRHHHDEGDAQRVAAQTRALPALTANTHGGDLVKDVSDE